MKNMILFTLIAVTLVSIGGILNIDAAEIGNILSIVKIDQNTPNGPDLADSDYFGSSIANIGDINGDGTNDIAVGAKNIGGIHVGVVHIITLNATGYPIDAVEINSLTPNGPDLNSGDAFGQSIANIGDINGDGIDDIAVGAFRDDAGSTNSGAVHIITLNSDGTPNSAFEINSLTPNGPDLDDHDHFGYSIANIGDVNGDGTNDIAVSATGDGAVHIITLNATGYPLSSVKIDDSTPNGPDLDDYDILGLAIANIGDINNDGIDDIAVSEIAGILGAVHIITLNATGYPLSSVKIDDSTPNGPDLDDKSQFGSSIANIGDINGDGTNDIAVGARSENTGGYKTGVVHIITLNATGYPIDAVEINSLTPNGPILYSNDWFGTSIANIGDINGDGFVDIAVGAPGVNIGGMNIGAVHIILLNPDGTPKSTVENYQDQIDSLNVKITQLNNTITTIESSVLPEYYLVEGDKKDMPGGSGAMRATVSCDAGDIAVSGGYYLGGITEGYRSIRIMDFHQTDNGEGWFMRMDNISNKFAEVYPSVMCAHYPN